MLHGQLHRVAQRCVARAEQAWRSRWVCSGWLDCPAARLSSSLTARRNVDCRLLGQIAIRRSPCSSPVGARPMQARRKAPLWRDRGCYSEKASVWAAGASRRRMALLARTLELGPTRCSSLRRFFYFRTHVTAVQSGVAPPSGSLTRPPPLPAPPAACQRSHHTGGLRSLHAVAMSALHPRAQAVLDYWCARDALLRAGLRAASPHAAARQQCSLALQHPPPATHSRAGLARAGRAPTPATHGRRSRSCGSVAGPRWTPT